MSKKKLSKGNKLIESFKSLPEWAQILLAVVVAIIVLAVLGPILSFLVDLVIGVVIAALVLGGGYLLAKKLNWL